MLILLGFFYSVGFVNTLLLSGLADYCLDKFSDYCTYFNFCVVSEFLENVDFEFDLCIFGGPSFLAGTSTF